MKQAFEAGSAAPGSYSGSPAPKTPSKATPRKKKAAASADDCEGTPTPKRKRASPKKKDVAVKSEPEEDGEEADATSEESEEDNKITPKKARVMKPKVASKSKTPVKSSVKKEDSINVLSMQPKPAPAIKNEEVEDTFVTAEEYIDEEGHVYKEEAQDARK